MKPTSPRDENILKMRNRGLTYGAIARAHGLCVGRVSDIIRVGRARQQRQEGFHGFVGTAFLKGSLAELANGWLPEWARDANNHQRTTDQ